MPELPEVEAARRLIMSHCLGGTIMLAHCPNDFKVFEGVVPKDFQEAMMGKKILSAHRKGKHLWLQLNCARWPTFQFGMSGAIIVKGVKGPQYKSSKASDEEEFPTSYCKVWFQLDTGVEVAFTDKRRFARIRLVEDPEDRPPIRDLGQDAFLALPPLPVLIKLMQIKRLPIKAVLLDQGFIAGIGNWVGDEVLYQAKIHPEQPANSLKESEIIRLHTAIREVLDKAVSVDADSDQYPRNWLFHHRWDKKLGMIEGNQIESITISGRTSAFVPNVQKYSGPELKVGKRKAAVAVDLPHVDEGMAEPPTQHIINAITEVAVDKDVTGAEKAGTSETPKRGRGRPPKTKEDSAVKSSATTLSPAGATNNAGPAGTKKRGRPPKLKTASASAEEKTELEETQKDSPSEPKRRGRPPKAKADASKEAVSKALEEAPAKEDEDDVAADVEDIAELDTAPEKEDLASPVTPKRRGRPPKAKPEAAEELEITKKAKVGKDEEGTSSPAGSAEPKRRGRPPKAKPETEANKMEGEGSSQVAEGPSQVAETAAVPTPKKRGRPPKAKSSS